MSLLLLLRPFEAPRSAQAVMAPVKEGRLAVQWQSSLLLVQKANKCWMHTVSTVSMSGEQWERQVGARARTMLPMQVDGARRQANAHAASAASINNPSGSLAREQGLTSVLFGLRNRGVQIQWSKNVPRSRGRGREASRIARLRPTEWVAERTREMKDEKLNMRT